MQRLKELLGGNELLPAFALSRIIDPVVIEMFGLAGQFRCFWLDQEHAALSGQQLQIAALAGRANQLDCFVRMPPTGYWQVTQCLEAGAGGVMAAQIHSAEQAAQFVSWARFAPQGVRGLNTSGFDARYTHTPASEFATTANEQVFVAIQIETQGALQQAAEIAALDGVDMLFIGPSDLSLALGVVGQFHSSRLWEAIEHVADVCRQHGKTWGAVVPDGEFAKRAIDNGCRMPSVVNDPGLLRRGIDATKKAFACVFE